MRTVQYLGAALAVVLVTACGGGDDQAGESPSKDSTGTASASASSTGSESATPPVSTTVTPGPSPFGGAKAWIAYQTDRTGKEGVWLVHPDGSEDHKIVTDIPESLLPDWSPDGTHLVVTTRGGDTEPVFEYDLKTDTSRQLFDCSDPCVGDDEPVYSPDGKSVAVERALGPFVGDSPTDCGLWIGDRATGKVHQVTSNTEPACDREYNPRWSPDGTRFVYWRQPDGGKRADTAVYVMNADGTGERRLTDPALEAGEADWSPDGKWIVYATHPLNEFGCCHESNLYRVHPDGSGVEQLTHFSGAVQGGTQPNYTPDGTWIVFTEVTPDSRNLWAIPSDGGDPVEIAQGGIYTHGHWQPQG
jgi:Tol biopolymer transport system component